MFKLVQLVKFNFFIWSIWYLANKIDEFIFVVVDNVLVTVIVLVSK